MGTIGTWNPALAVPRQQAAAAAERDRLATAERARKHQQAAARARSRAAARERQDAGKVALALRAEDLPEGRYLDREDSWLRFAQRVLELAEDPNVPLLEHHVFRVTRISDLEIDEDVTENLLQSLERELMRRRFEPAVRLEVEESISEDVLERLITELDVDRRAVYRVPGLLDLSGLSAIADLDFRNLKHPGSRRQRVRRAPGASAGGGRHLASNLSPSAVDLSFAPALDSQSTVRAG